MTLIDMRQATARIGQRRVLDGADLAVRAGEVVGLVGRNGAGKTSALRAMLGLLPLVSGSVRYSNADLPTLTAGACAEHAGYLPQERRIAWNMPAVEIVALATPFLGGEESRERAGVALASLRAESLADRGIAELSGGERAKVLIARALNTPGRALLLDEPVAGLDPDAQMFVLERLRAEAASGRGILISLHDLGAAARVCDRIAVMKDGRVIADAPPARAMGPDVLAEAFGVSAAWIAGPSGLLLDLGPGQGA